jgi:carbamoyltransferase
VFSAVFAIISCWPLLHIEPPRWWALGVAASFALLAIIRPDLLHPLNRAWCALGQLLHRVMTPACHGYHLFPLRHTYSVFLGKERKLNGARDLMEGAFLGPAFAQEDVERRLTKAGAQFTVVSDEDVIERTAASLAAGEAVGWMQGRMEFGPRALGARSILGDPRSPTMQKTLNLRVKYRESFRPFAPAVLREDVSDWFELDTDSPYMLLVADVKRERRRRMTNEEEALFGIDKLNVARSDIPAVTHVDYSARVQTVHADTNPRFHALISRFQGQDGLPGAGQHQLQRA